MLKSYNSLKYDHLFASNSETESDNSRDLFSPRCKKRGNKGKNIKIECKRKKKVKITFINGGSSHQNKGDKEAILKEKPDDDELVKIAEKYQEYMKQLPIPSPCNDHSTPFRTWQKMAEFVKKKYEQPLHYLTNIQLKQWDESTGDENRPIAGNIIHPSKAEAIILGVEEFNRKCSSHLYLAKLWHSDPKYRDFVDLVNSKN